MVIFVFLRSLMGDGHSERHCAAIAARRVRADVGGGIHARQSIADGLTISVGFVVDDAIVMLENITRYIEEGEAPLAAALKGSAEIGFTILSISISLIAVLIPLLLMGGIIGRLFREFAVTLSLTIVVSAVVSLTLTPMMAARFLPAANETHHGRLYELSERGFDALLNAYERGSGRRAAIHRFVTLLVFLATLALTVYLFVIIPKGFFPQQDTGLITGISQAAQDISVKDMMRHQEALGAIVLKDPGVAHVAMAIGGSGNPSNTGRMFITLKPRDQRDATADQIIARLQPKLDQGRRREAVSPGGAGRHRRGTYRAHAISVYAAGRRFRRTQRTGRPKMLAKMQALPELRDVASDQEASGTTLTFDGRSRSGLALRTDGADHRRHARRRVRTA